ncbi:biotin transporter BioY [Nocardioides sp. 1609]|uniref:biotin transporter BioY n=1 Tax=Nocardioides sp. 1609 TaxID=2508327 RepID=UPI00106FD7E3|nr:biotin transporter BioY [Nocardioides sp. 1609]
MTLHQPTETSTADRPRRFSPTDLALVASFAALISAMTYLGAVPVGGAGVPITLQTLGVMLAGCLLGPVRGTAAVLLYLLLGFIGLPVFAGHTSGPGVLSEPSVGYLLSFPIAAALGGFLVTRIPASARTRALPVFLCSIAASILVIHPMGIGGLMVRLDLDVVEAWRIDVLYWVGDLLKTTIVALVVSEVHRAFPQLLDRRR